MINKDSGDHLEIIDHKNKEPRAKFSSLRDTRWNRPLFCGAIRWELDLLMPVKKGIAHPAGNPTSYA